MSPAKHADAIPGISGTRNLSDNLSDLKAQVAANNKGISLVSDLIHEYGLPTVVAYMHHIQVSHLEFCNCNVCQDGAVPGPASLGRIEVSFAGAICAVEALFVSSDHRSWSCDEW